MRPLFLQHLFQILVVFFCLSGEFFRVGRELGGIGIAVIKHFTEGRQCRVG